MQFVGPFFCGAFLCNCIPHLVAGLQGARLPTVFGKPSGVGDSSPLVNFLWGAFNLGAGTALLVAYPFRIEVGLPLLSFVCGFLFLGIYLAVHFDKVMTRRKLG
jgi:hypothetical protein